MVTLPGMALGFELRDVTRDGVVDAVVSLSDPYSFLVYPGDGTGGFDHPTVAATNAGGYSFKLGDLNHDGWLDIVVDDGFVTVVLARGDGGGCRRRNTVRGPWDTASAPPWVTSTATAPGSAHWGGAMLFGNGQGGFGGPFGFELKTPNGLAYD